MPVFINIRIILFVEVRGGGGERNSSRVFCCLPIYRHRNMVNIKYICNYTSKNQTSNFKKCGGGGGGGGGKEKTKIPFYYF